MPPTTTGRSPAPAARRPASTSGTSCMCEPDSTDRPDAVHVLGDGRGHDLLVASAGSPGRRPRTRRRGPARPPAPRRCCARPARACRPAVAAAPRAPRSSGAPARAPPRGRRPRPRRPRPRSPDTPVGARYSPNTSRNAPAHSPVVTPARAHRSEPPSGSRPDPASARSCPSAAATSPPPVRPARPATAPRPRPRGPRRRGRPLHGGAEVRRQRARLGAPNRLTPTTTCSPDSIRWRRRACAATMADFM